MTTKRYIVEDASLSPNEALQLHRALVAWAASRADCVLLRIDRRDYEDPNEYKMFVELARERSGRDDGATMGLKLPPSEALVRALTTAEAPPKAIAGDLSPCEEVVILSNERRLYASYDYGRDQVLELERSERGHLLHLIRERKMDADLLVEAPPYLTEPS